MPTRSDPLLQQFLEEFRRLAEKKPVVTFELPVAHAWCLLMQIQIALGNPSNTGHGARIARQIGRMLQGAIAVTPAMQRMAERGWDLAGGSSPPGREELL